MFLQVKKEHIVVEGYVFSHCQAVIVQALDLLIKKTKAVYKFLSGLRNDNNYKIYMYCIHIHVQKAITSIILLILCHSLSLSLVVLRPLVGSHGILSSVPLQTPNQVQAH